MAEPAKRTDLVWVTWMDAVNQSSRAAAEELAGIAPATNTNLGWIAHESPTRIILAHGISSTGEVDHFCIPRANVVEVRPVVARRVKKAKEQAPEDAS